MTSAQQEIIGDNLEFNVATASDVTIDLESTNTSTSDTATTKYTDTRGRKKSFALRADEAVQIVSINGVVFTNPYSCVKNGIISEKLDTPLITQMVIRIPTNDTNIKLRVR